MKSFEIRKRLVYRGVGEGPGQRRCAGRGRRQHRRVRSEREGQPLQALEPDELGELLPRPVRAVEIPKDHGAGVRVLGVPNVADRIAQTAAAMLLEEKLEPIFHPDSYGYRPGRSPMTLWPWLESVVGRRTGCSILTSGPSSTAFPMICC